MNRYLLNIAYIGTRFSGIQRNINKKKNILSDTSTVQGCIELALKSLRSINKPELVLSSRTDSGVHALSSFVHVDLEKYDGTVFSVDDITSTLNKSFSLNNLSIRILKTIHVPNTFHCRFNAKARTYLYRIAIKKKLHNCTDSYIDYKKSENVSYVPIEDLERCFYIHNYNFDVNKTIKASTLFLGRHDFRTFMSNSRNKEKQDQPMYTIRTITYIDIKRGHPSINSYEYNKAEKIYDYWDIEITGKSFLYKQVRRIVGTLIAYGIGIIDIKNIYEMLTIPSKFTWNNRAMVAPPFGLYLCQVHYDIKDL